MSLSTGIALRVVEAGPPDGRPLVLVHGWGVSAYLWRHQLTAFAGEPIRAIAIDLPGHGLSDAPSDAGAYSLARYTAHVRALLDALALPRAVLAAQSMGGKIALQFALESPERVAALALFGPVGFGEIPPWQVLAPFLPTLPDVVAAQVVPRSVIEFVQRRVHGKLAWYTERDVDEYWAPTQFPEVVRAQLQMLKEFDWGAWDPAALARLAVPTDVIFGTRDRTVRPVHAERLVAALPGARLSWIDDGGHVVMEEVPERTNALLRGIVAGARLDSPR